MMDRTTRSSIRVKPTTDRSDVQPSPRRCALVRVYTCKAGWLGRCIVRPKLVNWLVPHPILAGFKTTPRILFDDPGEIALLAMAVHKESGRHQLVTVAFN